MSLAGADDTIFALATAEGRSGVAVVRVSGPSALRASQDLCGELGEPRKLCRRKLVHEDGSLIDDVLLVSFTDGRSFTGEDVVEFHSHGSIAVVRAISARLRRLPYLRDAQPGEFTRRAFENGKLDLTQVEGLADLIDAETEAQRRQAMSVYGGGLSRELAIVRQSLLGAASLCTASIDFADEEVPHNLLGQISENLASAISSIVELLNGHAAARRITDGIEVAIVGAPNVGKSTLLNALAGDDIAIVTDRAGTTRDILECRLEIEGRLVRLLDTAGLREADDPIEQEGVKRARIRAERADIRVFLYDGAAATHELHRPGDLTLLTKGDVLPREGAISARTGDGIDGFLRDLGVRMNDIAPKVGLVASERQAALLEYALGAAHTAKDLASSTGEAELLSHEIENCIRAVEEIIGRVSVEDVLGEVFSSFCIGK